MVRDISSGQRNENNLTQSEGGDHSAHIVIFKEKKGDRQVCLVERTNGLQGAALKSFFDYLGKLVAEENTDSFTIDHPEGLLDNKGRVKKRMILPKFNFHGYPSEQFFEDLENGRMNSISLVGEANQMRGIGDDLPPEFREVAIQLDADLSKLESWREFIGRNIIYGKEYNLEKLRVKFTDASGSSHTTEIEFDDDLNDGNLKYVKKRRVGMSFRPKSSYDQINVNFLKKMLEVCDG
ncbi:MULTISPECIES: hypothetical protein [unclassified Halomonas]|uniref:hypothetical protein n=1 Tax=unclassified Halomonas TaxID=2609666 RepID=UPI002076A325|nr:MULTISPECIES: hypothetical protein [unclassified Halomonas]